MIGAGKRTHLEGIVEINVAGGVGGTDLASNLGFEVEERMDVGRIGDVC